MKRNMSTTNLSDYYGPPYMYMNFDKDWQWGTSEHNVGKFEALIDSRIDIN